MADAVRFVTYRATAGALLALREATPLNPRPPKLLHRVRDAIGVRHYSRRTEKAYVHWIKRYIFFHGKRHPADMGHVRGLTMSGRPRSKCTGISLGIPAGYPDRPARCRVP